MRTGSSPRRPSPRGCSRLATNPPGPAGRTRAHRVVPSSSRRKAYRSDLTATSESRHLPALSPDAMEEAQRARDWLSGHPAVGMVFYQLGELYRLRGEFAEAEEAYRQANQWGHSPQPGLAELRLAEGNVAAAAAAIRRVIDEAQDRAARSRVLAAYVEIGLAIDDVGAARAAADELSQIAADLDAPLLRAVAARAIGAVLLAEGDARAACEVLRRAWTGWRELEAPYE